MSKIQEPEPIEVRPVNLPAELLQRLWTRRHGKFTDTITVFHAVCFDTDSWVGVVGDGNNGSYEWFFSTPDQFKVSEYGYGDSVFALREALSLVP